MPQLAGKTDVIPNRTNTMWIDPRETGTFSGTAPNTAECNTPTCLLRVVAQSRIDFERWAEEQKATPGDPSQVEGRAAFLSLSCINCHAGKGTPATGTFGPDLSHLMSRSTLASGMITNTVEESTGLDKRPAVH